MQVKFVHHPENDVIPYTPSKPCASEPALFELSSPFHPEKPNSRFWLRCHQCSIVANLGDHEVKIENSLVTISPSIDCPRDGCPAHYYIKNGEIQNC